MSFFKSKRQKRVFIAVAVATALIATIVIACAIYIGDYYRADEGAVAVFLPEERITVNVREGESVSFEPQNATAGFIFYPGGKVEHNAYQPLMAELARRGILCVLIDMPFNLAVLDVNAADGVREAYPEIESWYIGGHSLGGSMAATYLAKNENDFDGLVLLGSYSTADLSQSGVKVLSVYGSEDGVMNREKYEASKSNLPVGFTETVIVGGNHAGFGMYGPQDGDGTPTIPCDEQISATASEIISLINE